MPFVVADKPLCLVLLACSKQCVLCAVFREETLVGKLLLKFPDADSERSRAASQEEIGIRGSGRGEQRKC